MKKFFKWVGITLLGLIALSIIAIIVIKIFQEDIRAYTQDSRQEDYALLLQESKYAPDTLEIHPLFCMDDPKLDSVRIHFRLDTLFNGTESTYEKAIKLQRFVSDNLPHDNPPTQIRERNAFSLWNYVKETGNNINCRQHSILYRDMALSVGIKTRFITCRPYDHEDSDCHVVNEVWLPELKKWAMIDSDQDKRVTSVDGLPLSIRELRELIVANKPYLINGESNKGKYYHMYMSKNTYWFSRHEISVMDDESGLEGDIYDQNRRVYLIPVGFSIEHEKLTHLKDALKTTDPDQFWR